MPYMECLGFTCHGCHGKQEQKIQTSSRLLPIRCDLFDMLFCFLNLPCCKHTRTRLGSRSKRERPKPVARSSLAQMLAFSSCFISSGTTYGNTVFKIGPPKWFNLPVQPAKCRVLDSRPCGVGLSRPRSGSQH